MGFLIIVSAVLGFILLYVVTMFLNEKTPIPESCRQAYQEANSCESCGSEGCNIKDTIEFLKEVKL